MHRKEEVFNITELHIYIFLTVAFSIILGAKLAFSTVMVQIGKRALVRILIVTSLATIILIILSVKKLLELIEVPI